MFDWLNTIFEFFFELFPRLHLLPPTDGGVKFKPRSLVGWIKRDAGGRTVLLTPGRLYVYWPVTTEVRTIETKRRSLEVTQRLTTKDKTSVLVCTTIAFTVDDVIKAVVETTDFDDTIMEMGQKGTIKAVPSRTFDQILADMVEGNDLRNEVAQGARSALRQFGVKVEDAFMSSFAETRVFSHDGDGFVFGGDDGEE